MSVFERKFTYFESGAKNKWFVRAPAQLTLNEKDKKDYEIVSNLLELDINEYIELVKKYSGVCEIEETFIHFYFLKKTKASRFCSFLNKTYKKLKIEKIKKELLNEKKK